MFGNEYDEVNVKSIKELMIDVGSGHSSSLDTALLLLLTKGGLIYEVQSCRLENITKLA